MLNSGMGKHGRSVALLICVLLFCVCDFLKPLLYFFHYHLVSLYPSPSSNHHTVVHVHESFFPFCSIPPPPSLTPPPLAVILLSIYGSVPIICVLLRVFFKFQPNGGVHLPGTSIWTAGQVTQLLRVLDMTEKNQKHCLLGRTLSFFFIASLPIL